MDLFIVYKREQEQNLIRNPEKNLKMSHSVKSEEQDSFKRFKWCLEHKIAILTLLLTVLILFSITLYPLITRNSIELKISVTKAFEGTSSKKEGVCGYGYGWVLYKDVKCVKVMDIYSSEEDAKLICSIETQKDKDYQEEHSQDSQDSQGFLIPHQHENNPCELLTVKSSKELKFLTNLIFVKDKTMVGDEKVWLGAKWQKEEGEGKEGILNEEKAPMNFVWNDDKTNTMLHLDLGLEVDLSSVKSSPGLRNQLEPSHWRKGYPKDVPGRECVALVLKSKKTKDTQSSSNNNNDNDNNNNNNANDDSVKGLLENVSCSGRHLVVCQKRPSLSLSLKNS